MPGMRRGRFHPMMFREMLHMGPRSSPAVGVLILASMFRDSMPWVYEVGVEVYRVAKQGTPSELKEAAHEFRQAVEFSIHGPFAPEFFGRSKEMFMIMEEIEPLLERTFGMLDEENKPSRRRPKKESEEDA